MSMSKRATADRTWRKHVLERDKNTCQRCGTKDYEILTVHHIMAKQYYPNLRHEISNGITLCRDCHDFEERHENFRDEFIHKTLNDNRYNKALIKLMLRAWNEVSPVDISEGDAAIMDFIMDTLRTVGYIVEVDEESCNLNVIGRDAYPPDSIVY